MRALPVVSERRACRVLGVSRSRLRRKTERTSGPRCVEPILERAIHALIQRFQTFGYRRIWAMLNRESAKRINIKAVYRVLKLKGWFVNQRKQTPRPRVRAIRSRAIRRNQRWAVDVTHLNAGQDVWAHLTAIVDCHDREIVGYELALRGRAQEAERALEDAWLRRFGTLRPKTETPIIRSDNGLIFQSRRFRDACRDYRLRQEFITPYTPQQNGMIERFFRSLKEECVWLEQFRSFQHLRRRVEEWIEHYNARRPHRALNYLSPQEFRLQQHQLVA